MSEDPIGFAGGDMNLFRYVNNNPVLYSDPSGKDMYYNQNGVHTSVVISNPDMPGNTVTIDFAPNSGTVLSILLGNTVKGRIDVEPGAPSNGVDFGFKKTSHQQDSETLEKILRQQKNPPDYNLYKNNCMHYAGGIQ